MLVPELSVTVQITVFVPTAKRAGALLVMVTGPQLSATVGAPNATLVAPHRPAEATTVTRAGQVIVGGRSEERRVGKEQVTLLPQQEDNMKINVFVPTGKREGEW